jgi:PEP-CTERM motif
MACSSMAQAQNYSFFSCISGISDCGIGESQLGVRVIDNGSSVDFKFENRGPLPASITDIYFSWTNPAYALSTAGTITNSSGVSFSWGANPKDLPGGKSVGFNASIGADSNAPTQPQGVNPGEWVNFSFSGANYGTLLAGMQSGQLGIGIHVQGFASGNSASYVSTVPSIPEPEIYAMMAAGLGMMGWMARRRRLSSTAAN